MISEAIAADMFEKSYAEVFEGDERWAALEVPQGERYEWGTTSTYVRQPPYFEDMPDEPAPLQDIHGARALAKLGDSVTTDHISPAGNIRKESPAGKWLIEHDVAPADFNSYGSRRGNHEVMIRGTFANVRLRNQLAPGTEGGITTFFPTGEQATIYDAAMRYAEDGTPLVVLAGKEYGSGSSRDWAAKGTALLMCAPSWRKATSASTAPTLSGWACCRCSTAPASPPSPSVSPVKRSSTLQVWRP